MALYGTQVPMLLLRGTPLFRSTLCVFRLADPSTIFYKQGGPRHARQTLKRERNVAPRIP
jgi:hypothetical protein